MVALGKVRKITRFQQKNRMYDVGLVKRFGQSNIYLPFIAKKNYFGLNEKVRIIGKHPNHDGYWRLGKVAKDE